MNQSQPQFQPPAGTPPPQSQWTAPDVAHQPPGPSGGTPFLKRRWVIGVASGVVGLMVGIGGSNSGEASPDQPVPTVTATALATVTATTQSTITESAAPQPTTTVTTTAMVTETATVETTVETTVTAEPDGPAVAFGDGMHVVGVDIQPGTYRAPDAGDGCYWERLSDADGEFDSIIANSLGDNMVTIKDSDKYFSSSRCGDWTPLP